MNKTQFCMWVLLRFYFPGSNEHNTKTSITHETTKIVYLECLCNLQHLLRDFLNSLEKEKKLWYLV